MNEKINNPTSHNLSVWIFCPKYNRSNIIKTIAVIGLMLFQFVVIAQQPPIWNINEEDGIPSLTIYDLIQDEYGYIWLGAENGAFRYDGMQFQGFFNKVQKGRSLTNFQKTPDGRIWMTNFHGQLFFYENDSLHHFEALDSIPHPPIIEKYIFDKKGNLWIGNPSSNQVFCFHPSDSTWSSLQLPQNTKGKAYFRDMLGRSDGSVWLNETQTGLWQIHPTLKCYGHPKNSDKLQFKLLETDNGILLVDIISADKTHLFLFTPQAGFRQLDISINARATGNGYKDQAGNIWLSTYEGVWALDSNFELLDLPQPILPDKIITATEQDAEGAYWFSTLGNGVYFMPSKTILLYDSEERISCLAKDDKGRLLIGTSKGKVSVLDNQEIVHSYQGKKNRVNDVLWNTKKQELLVAQDRVYHYRANQTNPYQASLYASVKSIALDAQQNLIAATSVYPIVANIGDTSQQLFKERFPLIEDKDIRRVHLRKKRSQRVFIDRFQPKQLWISYVDGLYRHTESGDYPIPLPEGVIPFSLTQTDDGTIWVGSVKDGVLAIRKDSVVLQVREADGLISSFCRVLKTDGKLLWIGTDKGLQTYNPETAAFTSFNQTDGLAVSEIMDLELETDKVWIATPKGLHEMSLQEQNTQPVSPPIYINNIAIWERDTSLHDYYELNYKQNNLKIDFHGLSFRSFKNLRYKYRLLGLDSTWIFADNTHRFARYPSLPSGTYQFQVKAIGMHGVESTEAAEVEFFIAKPYWQQWWFVLLSVIGIVALVGGIFWKVIRDIQRRVAITQALRNSKLSALRAQMNPHFLFNAINSIQDFILLNDKRQANSYLAKFASLMRLILEMSSKDYVDLEDEIKALGYYLELEALRFSDTMEYELYVDPQLEDRQIKIPPMLIQPHVENAIKHGLLHRKTNRLLWVKLELAETALLRCTIEDNGVGREAAAALRRGHKGFGTFSTKESLRLLNKDLKHQKIGLDIIDLTNTDGKASGTKVILSIPFLQED